MSKQKRSIVVFNFLLIAFHGLGQTLSINQTATTFIGLNSTSSVRKMAKYSIEGKSLNLQAMSEVGSVCVEDGFFPDREDCRKFHVCYSGTQSVRWCKEGMVWDSNKVGCSQQNATLCPSGRKKWPESNVELSRISTQKAFKGNYTCRSGATGLFADPSSCSIYHWCILGVLHSSHQCNLGLHFSPSASGCILPKDAECEGQIAPPYAPIDCSLGTSGYFPDPYDCSVFHYCNGAKNKSESLLCTAGRLWSSRHENCVLPDEVTECENTCPPNYSSQMRFADPITCSRYIQCVDGRLEQRVCPNNQLFDRITKTCRSREQAECHGVKPDVLQTPSFPYRIIETTNSKEQTQKKQHENQFVCLVDGYFGDPTDCRVYHVCIDGRDFRSSCAAGLVWESLLRLCMPSSVVRCPNSKSFDSSPGLSKNKWFDTLTRPIVKTTTHRPQGTSGVSIFTCSGRDNGYYPDPVHCDKFHYCATGWQSYMECDEGLAYSSEEHDCVPLEYSDCQVKRK